MAPDRATGERRLGVRSGNLPRIDDPRRLELVDQQSKPFRPGNRLKGNLNGSVINLSANGPLEPFLRRVTPVLVWRIFSYMEPSEVTSILRRMAGGDTGGMGELFPLVYGDLRQLAASKLRNERPDHTLSPTSLVHEAFLRLTGQASVSWEGRSHFFGVAALAMRRILVDHARRRSAHKRSHQHQVTLDDELRVPHAPESDEVLAVDEALDRLAALDERQARVVELRYFVGLSIEETADVLGVSIATVKRDWMVARAWLQRELTR